MSASSEKPPAAGKDVKQVELTEEYRALLTEERKSLGAAILDQSKSFDKYVLTLASGALALSLTFIEKIVPHPDANTISILIGAWAAFGLSILLTLVSFLFSQKACRKNIDTIDGLLTKAFDYNNQPPNRLAIFTDLLNWISMFSFVTGVALLTAFTVRNITLVAGG